MIARIKAHYHRCFAKLAVDLDRCHVPSGVKWAGKTALFGLPGAQRHARAGGGRGGVPGTAADGAFASCGHADWCLYNEPKLEARIMSDNPKLVRIFCCPENHRQVLATAGQWPDGVPKPPRLREAFEHLRKRHGVRRFNVDFGKLAATMSVSKCQDPALNQLCGTLRAWSPEQQ